MSNPARARHFHNLTQHVDSMMAQIEAPSSEMPSSSMEFEARAPKAKEYLTSNTYLLTPNGGYQCTYPGCAAKTIFISKIKFENHQLQHFPKKFPCLACDQVFERMESCPSHNANQTGGK
ncbi:hypothetical protein Q9L58_006942 [Maublancomyces gigas]|uniref:C2H2-type domain-containing protein n=1 Tax=Discina gigas TaxID=1032678 RepID=A0ABR3GEB5_9PEZI